MHRVLDPIRKALIEHDKGLEQVYKDSFVLTETLTSSPRSFLAVAKGMADGCAATSSSSITGGAAANVEQN